ncbi:hypothetical protein E2R51_03500 [Jeotgalibacillus sp. S-D1]|uniref:class I SAM-dependent methyltransferase n=1 Tax=Jeotgalibacillus sp. S-D1 TaxID=2552189 RepID=UPI0010595802|nr:class I SAM-dependent methyltransferase [Jeotgalibacillus sp. S-D1]TDL34798.1 hypothetical protein E2R51_03500 [Jeotgalibacillus sp. S-D1]
MIITTAGRPSEKSNIMAIAVAKELNAQFIKRNKKSINKMYETYQQPIIVITENRYEYYFSADSEPFFFHPNSSAFRAKRMLGGEKDPLISAAQFQKGDSFLDCTAGMGSDAIIASLAAGAEGRVIGIECNPVVAYLVQNGLRSWKSEIKPMEDAMKRINIYAMDHLEYLKMQPDQSFDVIYFDPMFTESVLSSSGINHLRPHAAYSTTSLELAVNEAKRVGRKRIVLKDYFRSHRFKEFGFTQMIRPSSKQHYGFIEL